MIWNDRFKENFLENITCRKASRFVIMSVLVRDKIYMHKTLGKILEFDTIVMQ